MGCAGLAWLVEVLCTVAYAVCVRTCVCAYVHESVCTYVHVRMCVLVCMPVIDETPSMYCTMHPLQPPSPCNHLSCRLRA